MGRCRYARKSLRASWRESSPCLAPIITAENTAGTIAGPIGRIAVVMEAHVMPLNLQTGTAICTTFVLVVIMTDMLPA
ncbi:hypothetical protein AD952_13445 [Acetobacter cerevisiae]|uniref:Uncharacterized protein n=1 Tax=Acetobacter cerevisiae TaxID=178900 RepID=A0A149UQJ3_9PROT|nr:hypothetical protein AD952_13445 [Acetobacter cerevisiae]